MGLILKPIEASEFFLGFLSNFLKVAFTTVKITFTWTNIIVIVTPAHLIYYHFIYKICKKKYIIYKICRIYCIFN